MNGILNPTSQLFKVVTWPTDFKDPVNITLDEMSRFQKTEMTFTNVKIGEQTD